MWLSIPLRLGLHIGWRALWVPALGLLLASCADPAGPLSSPFTPPERPTASAQRSPSARIDVAPLAAVHKAKPADPEAALAYARALREAGSAPKALAVLDKASALKPADKRLLLERGLLALELGEPAKAEPLLRKAVVMHLTTGIKMNKDQNRQAGAALPEGTIEGVGERGVWVPPGMTAEEIMRGAAVLEAKFEIEHYQARSMVRWVLQAIRDVPDVGSQFHGPAPTA